MASVMFPIAVLPGDGIGVEVVAEAVRVLQAADRRFQLGLELREGLIGWAAVRAGRPRLPEETRRLVAGSRAVLFGAAGLAESEGLPPKERPERALLELRKLLDCYANLRPVRVLEPLIPASPLRAEIVRGVDFVVVRELTGGLYFGEPRGIERLPDGRERAVDTMVYSTDEIERVVRFGFDLARGRRRRLVCVDKANALETSTLWRRVVDRLAADHPDIAVEHMYVDTCAMQLLRRPRDFDVIVTENLFGDILTDEAAALTGSIGMLPSASLGAGAGLFEPIHGSAPDIAGKGIANPLGAILSAALLLRHACRREDAAAAIEEAVHAVLLDGKRTADLSGLPGPVLTCPQMGDAVLARL
jgi:3-isopropylmalate dehydrogenase